MSLIFTFVFAFCAILVCIVVLIQEGKGGGLGGAFGGAGQQTFGVGTRGITRFTAGVVIVMMLSALATHKFGGRASDSVLEGSSESVFDSMPGADGAGADQAPAGN